MPPKLSRRKPFLLFYDEAPGLLSRLFICFGCIYFFIRSGAVFEKDCAAFLLNIQPTKLL